MTEPPRRTIAGPDSGVVDAGDAPASGPGHDDESARDSLPPSADTRPGPRSDVDRAQPYDEQPTDFRMVDQPPPDDRRPA